MPIYEYRCPNGHRFEVFQSMSDDPVTTCEECGAPVERVFHPIAVHFKGSGFYTTDYAKKGIREGERRRRLGVRLGLEVRVEAEEVRLGVGREVEELQGRGVGASPPALRRDGSGRGRRVVARAAVPNPTVVGQPAGARGIRAAYEP